MIEPLTLLTSIWTFFKKAGDRAIYPFLPFLLVPGALVAAICYEVGTPGLVIRTGSVRGLSFRTVIAQGSPPEEGAGGLLLIDSEVGEISVKPSTGDFTTIRFPYPVPTVEDNSHKFSLARQRFWTDTTWFDTEQPLAVFVEGALPKTASTRAGEDLEIEPVALTSATATAIALACSLFSIFGLGYAAAFGQTAIPRVSEKRRRDETHEGS